MANRGRDRGSAHCGTPRAGRTAWGMGFVISGLFMMIAPPWADGSVAPAPTVAASKISVQQSFTGTDAGCLPASLGMTFTTTSSDTSFVLNVITNVRPCQPIAATAAIYAMPGNGVAWPQTLVETRPFTLDRVGVTSVTFTKTCAPAQFDVVTGPTPPVIDPLGASHGPLLIPDIASAQQWWGRPCVDPTTTTAAAPTTTSVGATSTTAPGATTSTVPASTTSTTIAPATSTTLNLVTNSTTTTIGAAVEGATANRTGSSGGSSSPTSSGGGSGVSGSGLAVTGSSIALAIAAGLAQVAIGAALIISARRIVR